MSNPKGIGRLVKHLRGRDEVSALFLYGPPGDGIGSAVGLGVLLSARAEARAQKLKERYGAIAAALCESAVEVAVLNTAPLYLVHHILRRGTVLCCRDARHRMGFTRRAVNQYLDSNPIEILTLEELADEMGLEFY